MADQLTADPTSNLPERGVDLVADGRADANASASASAEISAAIPTENFLSNLAGATNPTGGNPTDGANPFTPIGVAPDANAAATDPSGNVGGNPASLEPGSGSAPTLSVNAANPSDVVFTVAGLQNNYSGTVTFTDSTGKSDVVPIAGSGTYSTNLSNLTDGTLTYVLKASDPKGNTVTVDPTTQLGLPAGVTLQQIDGGPTYYASNGFTDAANAGWDNPGFFPIGPWFSQLVTQTDANTFKAVGWNTVFGLTSSSNLSLADTNGISVVLSTPGGGMLSAAGAGPETVGIITDDEPSTFAEGASTPISSTADSEQDGRFWWVNNTWNFIEYGAWTGTPSPDTAATDLTSLITTPDGTQRSIGVSSIDDYFFASANATATWDNGGFFGQLELGLLDNLGQNATADQVARGSNYGQLITDEEQITGGNTPLYAYIEVGGPYTGDTSASNYITPPELNWAVWSSIIHGARGIIYFDNSFAGPAVSDQDIEDSYYQTVQPGQTVSIDTQIQQTDALVAQLAPVINSPTALNYVTVSTPSYENGQVLSQFGGIEVTAKDYNGQFYIFADTADSQTQTNITATFTLADPNATSVTVVGENRTIPVVNGQFTDTFATAATVHIYEVNDNGSSPPPALPAAPVISSGVVNSNKSVTLTGTAPDGSTVTLSDTGGTTTLGTVTANSSTGAWSYTTTPLVAGGYAFTASDTTSAGTSALGRIFVTVTSPSGAAPTPTISSGVANSFQSVTLTGSAAGGATVTVSDAGGVLGTTTASGTGAWSYTTAALVAGSYAFTATDATATVGPSVASSAFHVTVTASSAPAAPVISSGVVNSNLSVTLSGSAPNGSTVTVSDGGSSALGTTTASGSGSWSYTTVDLAAGSYAFTAADTTSAGTSAASSPFDVTVKPAAPVISSGVVNSNDSVTLMGTAPDGATVTVSDGGSSALGTTTASGSGSGSWSYTTVDLAAGSYAFTATDTTSAGTSAASSPFDVTVKPAAPVISSGVVNSNDSVTLMGTAPDGATVTVSDGGSSALGTTTASGSGSWSYTTVDLAAGSYAFTATDTTSAGTSAASSPFDVTVKPAAPVISSGVVNSNDSVTLMGTAPDGATVTVSDGGSSALGTTTASSSGSWSYTTVDLAAGSYAFTATDTTSAGTSSATSPFDVMVTGTAAPPPPVINTDTANRNRSVTLTGTAEADATVTVYDGTTRLGKTTANASGAWSYTTHRLPSGSQVFTATETVAGQTSGPSNAIDPIIGGTDPTDPTQKPDNAPANGTTTDLSGNVGGNPASLEPGSGSAPTLSVNAANPSDVVFTVAGLQNNYSGTVTFTDSTGKSDVVPIAGSGTYSTNLSNLTDGTLTYVLKASDPKGNTVTVDPTTQLGLPAGVTLQQIDGGPTYYASNGFTDAANAGWDNPGFFPIGPWFSQLVTQTDANTFKAVGWNTVFGLTSSSNLSLADTNGISVVLSTPGGGMLSAAGAGPETVGIITDDEPSTFAEGASTPISSTADSEQDGRFWWVNNTWNFIQYGAWTGTPSPDTAATDLTSLITTPDGTQRSIGVSSIDDYFFASANATATWFNNGVGSFGQYELGLLDNLGKNATADQVARGSNYGQLITDEEQITGGNTPLYAYIEVGGPYTGDTSASDYITPPELNWAVWSSIIHGARGIIYFDNTFGGPAQSDQDIEDSYYQTVQPGQTVSIYTQIQQTDAQVAQLAPVINSPTALNYVTVSTPSYENGQVLSQFGGIEVTAKDYNGQFYIFADTADSLTQTNISATFTIADPNATSVTVVGENRTIPVVNGQFTDTFATAATVHVYEVNDNGSSPPPPLPAAPVISSGVVNSNKSVTLTGTAPDGSTVTLSDTGGTTALGTVTANSSTGAWSYTTTPLVAGGYAFTASDTTSAGTSALGRIFVTVTSPTGVTPPAAPTISSGVANSLQSVTLTGSAVAGSTVTVSDAGGVLGTTTASGAGAWSYTTAALVAGSYAFTATDATAAAGPSAASSAFNVTVTASSAPAAPVISSGVVNSNLSVTLSGTAPGGSTVTVSDGAALGSATASSAGAWSFTTADLPGGTYAFTATDATSAGTSAASKVYGVAIPGSSSDTTITVSSGVTSVSTVASNTTYIVEGSGTLDVLSGGVVTGTTVSSGGSLQISSGGVASGTVVSSGGQLLVSSGGVASGTQVSAGGFDYVSSGGTATSTTVDSGGGQTVVGTASDTTVSSGGYQAVVSGGAANVTTLSGGIQYDYGTATSTTVDSGGTQDVYGTAASTTINSGGSQIVVVGGTATSTTVNSGGTQTVYGTATSTMIHSGGTQAVVSGGAANITTLSGGIQYDYGTATSTTLSGGIQYDYGTATSTTVDSGGTQAVVSGGAANVTTLSGGSQYDYGTATSTTVDSGGGQTVAGTASNTTVSSGGYQAVVSGGAANITTLSGGIQYDYGTATSTTVSSGGTQDVYGTATTTTVDSGGTQAVVSGGAANVTTLSGGSQYDYGTATSTTVDSGGGQTVVGTASDTTVSSGGYQAVVSGGAANVTTLSGGIQYDYGTATSTTVDSGGTQDVYGTAASTTINSGGSQIVVVGGTATSTTVNSGGTQTVYGTATSTMIHSGGTQAVVSGGAANITTLSGGIQYDYGTATSTTVSSGGTQDVYGTATTTTVDSGGTQAVVSGGAANVTTLSGGIQYDYGTATSTTVSSGGYLIIQSGGVGNATKVSAGGVEYVLSGGMDSGTTLVSGTEVVSSGGVAIGTVLSGGTEVMSAGAVASGTFDFASNGDLIIDQTSGTFGASISGLTNSGQILDFANIASSGASVSYSNSGTSGTLTVTNGTNSVSVNLIGTYSAGSFKSANDGSGGIEVYDPPQVPNGGVVTSSGTTNSPLTSGGSTTAGGLSPNAYEFNHTLFASYAAALSDQKAFGSSTPVLGNNANPLTSASILTSPIFNQHRH